MIVHGKGIWISSLALLVAMLYCFEVPLNNFIVATFIILLTIPLMAQLVASIVRSGEKSSPPTLPTLVGLICAAVIISSEEFISLVNDISIQSSMGSDLALGMLRFLGETLTITSLFGGVILLSTASVTLIIETILARTSARDLLPIRAFHSILILAFLGLSLQFISGLFENATMQALKELSRG